MHIFLTNYLPTATVIERWTCDAKLCVVHSLHRSGSQ